MAQAAKVRNEASFYTVPSSKQPKQNDVDFDFREQLLMLEKTLGD